MQIQFFMDEKEVKEAIRRYIEAEAGTNVNSSDVKIQVKSKQNYKAEWEEATIKAEFSRDTAGDGI